MRFHDAPLVSLFNLNEFASGMGRRRRLLPVGLLTLAAAATTLGATLVNDDLAGATVLTGASLALTAANGGATKESGEPSHAGNSGGASVWWTWTAPSSGVVAVDTIGSDFNTLLAVYTGSAVGSLTSVASDDDSGFGGRSKLSFNAVAGTVYRIAVDGFGGASGSITLGLNYAYAFTTFAGSGAFGHVDGTGSGAVFRQPAGVALDNAGNLYVADLDDHTIRKITPMGVVTTLAGLAGAFGQTDGTGSGARFAQPAGVAVDLAGNVFVVEHGNGAPGALRKITPAGVVTTVATGFNQPWGVAVDAAGNVFVTDSNDHTIKKVTLTPSVTVTTIAGQSGVYGDADGPLGTATLGGPTAIAIDGAGNILVATGSQTIRKLTPAGNVSTVAGSVAGYGAADGRGSAARFDGPYGLAFDSAGALLVAERGVGNVAGHTIRRISPAGVVTTLAGQAGFAGSGDGVGNVARFREPIGIAVNAAGDIFVGDVVDHRIRRGVAALIPQIQTPPQGQIVVVGGTATLAVGATSALPLVYQWKKDNADLAGATGAALTLSVLQPVDAGSYTVVVGNLVGTITSAAAALAVNVPPAPVVATIAPTTLTAGASATLTGSGFTGVTAVKFNGRVAVFTVGSDTAITATVPLGVSSGAVTVTGPGGTSGSGVTYTATASAVAQTLYVATGAGGANAQLYVVDPVTAAVTLIGDITVDGSTLGVTGLAPHPLTGLLYGITGGESGLTRRLITINPANAHATLIGTLNVAGVVTGISDLSFDVNGTLYGWKTRGGPLATINLTTAAVTFIGAGANGTGGNGLAFAPDGSLYVAGPPAGALFRVNPASGALTFVATLSGAPAGFDDVNGLTSNAAGQLYAVSSANPPVLVTINPTTGVITTIGAMALTNADAIAFAVTPAGPIITTPPVSVAVLASQPANFSVTAGGSGALHYQWKFNDATIAGATTATLSIAAATPAQAGTYRVVVADAIGSVTSVGATLTVNSPPAIAVGPAPTAAIIGGTLTLTAQVSGTPPFTYQWRFTPSGGSAGDVAGANGPTLIIPGFSPANAGSYALVVSNAFGSNVTSSAATVVAASAEATWVADPGFTRPQFRRPMVPGRVARSPADGKLYVTFNTSDEPTGVNQQRIGSVVRLTPAGVLDPTFVPGAGLTMAWGTAFQTDGRILVGGVEAKESADSGPIVYRVFRLNADGSRDESYASPSLAGLPRFMTLQPDGKLLVAPFPTGVGGAGIATLARLLPSGALDLTFAPPTFDASGDGVIFAPIVVDGSGRILIGGTFTQVNGVARANLARLLADGTLDPVFVPSGYTTSGTSSQVRGLAVQGLGGNSGKILVAGGALNAGGSNRPVLRLDAATGALDGSFSLTTQAGAGMAGRPRMLVLNPATDGFTLVGATVARFTATGAIDEAYSRPVFAIAAPGIPEAFWIEALADGSVVVPIDFGGTVNGTASSGLVHFTNTGAVDPTFNPGTFQHEAYGADLFVPSDNHALFFGNFATVNSSPRAGLARLGPTGEVDALALSGLPDLLGVEGGFLRTDGGFLVEARTGTLPAAVTRSIRLFNAAGGLNSTYTMDPAVAAVLLSGEAEAEPLADDRLLVGYNSPQRVVNGSVYFVRVKADGTIDTNGTFTGLPTTNLGAVYRTAGSNIIAQIVVGEFRLLAHYADGGTLAAIGTGSHPQDASTLAVRIVRLTPAGTVDPAFNGPSLSIATTSKRSTDPLTDSVATPPASYTVVRADHAGFVGGLVLPDNRVIVGGDFSALGDHATTQLARLTATGQVDPSFSTGTGPALRYRPGRYARISHVAVAPDGKYWVTGVFDTFDGQAAPGIVRLNSNGSVDPTFATDVGYRSYLNDDTRVAFAADGSVWLAGSYAKRGEVMPYALTRLVVPTAPVLTAPVVASQSVVVGGNLTLSVAATANPSPTYQWRLDGNPVPGATAASLVVSNATDANAGDYTVAIANAFGTLVAGPIHLAVVTSDLVTLSVQSRVLPGRSSSSSFTIEGSQPKTVLVRAAGPALAHLELAASFLSDPRLQIYDRNQVQVGANNDWGTSATFAAANQPGVAPIFSDGSKDAAVQLTLVPGTYDVVVDGNDGGGGLTMLQIYDQEPLKPRLVMFTARGDVGTGGEVIVVGFTIAGTRERKLLLRAPGEQLLGENYDYRSRLLLDPMIRVYDSDGEQVAFNDDWPDHDSTVIAAAARVGAPPFAGSTLDTAILVDLAPGHYTAELVGYGSSTGEGMIEIFEVDEQRSTAFAPALTWVPSDQVGIVGQEAAFSVHAIGRPAVSYQWRRGGVNLAGATSQTLRFTALQSSDASVAGVPVLYDVVVTNAQGSVTSPGRTLTLLPEFHAADSNHDHRISLFELTRVIELYNRRDLSTRTGEYHSQAASEDGFMPGPGTLLEHHSADSNHNGRIELNELTRVIELFNYLEGSVRTGEYHAQVGTEDGFDLGPYYNGDGEFAAR